MVNVIVDIEVLLRTIDSASDTASPFTGLRGVFSRLPPNRRTVDVDPVGGDNSEQGTATDTGTVTKDDVDYPGDPTEVKHKQQEGDLGSSV